MTTLQRKSATIKTAVRQLSSAASTTKEAAVWQAATNLFVRIMSLKQAACPSRDVQLNRLSASNVNLLRKGQDAVTCVTLALCVVLY